MKERLQNADKHSVIFSILMIVIGLVLVLWPGHVMTSAMTVLGLALLAGGIVYIVAWYRKRSFASDVLTLAEGILLAVAGAVVLAAPRFLISIIPWAVGLVVLVNGVVNLAQALDQRRKAYDRWMVSLVLAVLTIVLGLLIVCNPFSTMEMLVIAIGIIIIYNGVSNLWIDSRYRKI